MSVRTLSECIRGSIVSLVLVEYSLSHEVGANSTWGLYHRDRAIIAYNMPIGLARGQDLCVCTANVIQGHIEQENTKPLC